MTLCNDIYVSQIFPMIFLKANETPNYNSLNTILLVSKDWKALGWATLNEWGKSNPKMLSLLFFKAINEKSMYEHGKLKPSIFCLFKNLGKSLEHLRLTTKPSVFLLNVISSNCLHLKSIELPFLRGKRNNNTNDVAHLDFFCSTHLKKIHLNQTSSRQLKVFDNPLRKFTNITHLQLTADNYGDMNFKFLRNISNLKKLTLTFSETNIIRFSNFQAKQILDSKIRYLKLCFYTRSRPLTNNIQVEISEFFIKTLQNSQNLHILKICNKTNLSDKLSDLNNFDFTIANGKEILTKKDSSPSEVH